MCEVSAIIEVTRDNHRTAAKIQTAQDLMELNYHLAIEAEKLLRRHEARCEACQKAVENESN